MNDTRTLIAIPCMDMVATPFMYSLICMRRTGLSRVSVVSNTLVYKARNMLAAEAIDSGCGRVLWLDSDMQFEPGLMEQLSADMDTGLDFVCGLYFRRIPPIAPVIYSEAEERKTEVYMDYPKEQLFPVRAAGFGACMTSTEMLKDVWDTYGAPFNPTERGMGEDMAFCIRARHMGYKLWCDSRIKVKHIGTAAFGEEQYLRMRENAAR